MTKDRLRAFRHMLREGRQLRDQLIALEARMYSPKAQRFSSTPHGHGGEGRTMDDLAAVHIELQDNYRQRLIEIEREQLEIEKALLILTPEQRMIIRYRYIDLLGWEDVCDRVHYGWSRTHELHAAALRKLEQENSPGD